MSKEQVTITREELEKLQSDAEALKVAKAKQKTLWQRRNAKLMIYKAKAEAAGIEVTEKEIDEYLK